MTSDLLCNDYKDEWKLCTLIKVRQCKPDKDSVILTKTLLQEFANKPPFHLSYTTTSSLSRHMIGNELADELGLLSFHVPGQIVMILLYWFLRTVSFIQRGIPPLERGMYAYGSHCLNTLLEQSLKGRKPSYIMKVYSWTRTVRGFLKLFEYVWCPLAWWTNVSGGAMSSTGVRRGHSSRFLPSCLLVCLSFFPCWSLSKRETARNLL